MLNNKFSNMELFELFVGFIQLLDYSKDVAQISNDEISFKLEEQNNIYLKNIIENQKIIINYNKEIISKLNNILDKDCK